VSSLEVVTRGGSLLSDATAWRNYSRFDAFLLTHTVRGVLKEIKYDEMMMMMMMMNIRRGLGG